jgi:hypothetical protein
VLKNVLMNPVVCEPRQRVSDFVHVHFRFRRTRGLRQPQDGFHDASQFALRQQLSALGLSY